MHWGPRFPGLKLPISDQHLNGWWAAALHGEAHEGGAARSLVGERADGRSSACLQTEVRVICGHDGVDQPVLAENVHRVRGIVHRRHVRKAVAPACTRNRLSSKDNYEKERKSILRLKCTEAEVDVRVAAGRRPFREVVIVAIVSSGSAVFKPLLLEIILGGERRRLVR